MNATNAAKKAGRGSWTLRIGAAAVVAALAACSSSSPKTAVSATTSATTSPSTSVSTSASAFVTPGPADAATTAAVKKAYETFFDYRMPAKTTESLLQDGAAFKPEIASNAKLAAAQKVTVKVTTVSMVSANTAKVLFNLYLAGAPTLQNTSGYAVRENGTWKVSGQTFCALLSLNGSKPTVCTDPAAISLPG